MKTDRKKDNGPILNESFKDPSGKWGGESNRDAVPLSFDRSGQPVDRVGRSGEEKLEFPYYR